MDMEIRNKLEAWIDAHYGELVEDIKRLVRIPSVATYDEAGYPFGEGCKRVLDEAKKCLKVRYLKEGSQWYWLLPEEDQGCNIAGV